MGTRMTRIRADRHGFFLIPTQISHKNKKKSAPIRPNLCHPRSNSRHIHSLISTTFGVEKNKTILKLLYLFNFNYFCTNFTL